MIPGPESQDRLPHFACRTRIAESCDRRCSDLKNPAVELEWSPLYLFTLAKLWKHALTPTKARGLFVNTAGIAGTPRPVELRQLLKHVFQELNLESRVVTAHVTIVVKLVKLNRHLRFRKPYPLMRITRVVANLAIVDHLNGADGISPIGKRSTKPSPSLVRIVTTNFPTATRLGHVPQTGEKYDQIHEPIKLWP